MRVEIEGTRIKKSSMTTVFPLPPLPISLIPSDVTPSPKRLRREEVPEPPESEPKPETPKSEPPESEPKPETPKSEPPKSEPKPQTPKSEPPEPPEPPESAEPDTIVVPTDYVRTHTLRELKNLCETRGLSAMGKKAELAARLTEYDERSNGA